jgi:hypothetical protein
MRPLSKTAEMQLISAIERAATLVNDGLNPNDAIVKSAQENNIPFGHLDLMVHAYNTGRTTKQREQGESTLEKAADFSLADISVVKQTIHPANVKTSAQIFSGQTVSPEYALPPNFVKNRTAAKTAVTEKYAFAPSWTPEPRDEQAAARRSYSEKRAAQLAEEEKRRQATVAHSKAAESLDAVADYFRHPGNMSFQDAVREVNLRFGHTGVSVLEKVAEVYPQFKKQAETSTQHFGDNEIYRLVPAVVTAIENYNQQKPREKEAQVTEKSAPVTYTGSVLDTLSDAPIRLKIAGDKPGMFSPMMPVKVIGESMGMGGPKVSDGPLTKKLTEGKKQYNNLGYDQDSAIKNIRARGVLHDLVLNDPIISGHDPQDVAMAFNDVAELAPNLVDTPGMLQSVLRKRLESGQLADFDVKQILEMDKLRAERDKLQGESRKLNIENM